MQVAVAPHQILAELAAVHQILVLVQLGVVDVRLTLVAPDREVGEAQRQRMVLGNSVQRAVLVDVSRAEGLEAQQTHPVLDGGVAISALALVVDCWEGKNWFGNEIIRCGVRSYLLESLGDSAATGVGSSCEG